jgi:hypothetical protein
MESTEYNDNDGYGEIYRLPNDWIQRYIESIPPEQIHDTEPTILRKIKNKLKVILNDYDVSYICESRYNALGSTFRLVSDKIIAGEK